MAAVEAVTRPEEGGRTLQPIQQASLQALCLRTVRRDQMPLTAQISALHKAVPAEVLDLSPCCSWEHEEIHSFLNWVVSKETQRL